MPVPQEKEIRRPLLELVRGESPQNFSLNDFLRIMASHFGEDLNEMTTADKAAFRVHIKEARAYLKKHNLLSNPSLQAHMITKQGIDVLNNTTGIIDDPESDVAPEDDVALESELMLPKLPELEEPEELDIITKDETPDAADDSLDAEDVITEDGDPDAADDSSEAEEDIITETEEMPGVDITLTEDEAPDTQADSLEAAEDIIIEDETLDAADDSLEAEEMPEDITLNEETAPELEDAALDSEAELDTEDITLDSEEDYMNGEEIMPDEELTQDNDELTEDFQDAAVIQSQSIEDVLARHNSELADRVLIRAAGLSSDMFEVLVIDLLSKMGYRAFQNARYTNSASDDGMIQGVILDTNGNAPIYIHAKKLSPGRTVRRSEVKEFAEALEDLGGTGIFATTAEFSENAAAYAQDERIMLIDGAKLAGLMIAHNFCVNIERVFEIKEIDEDSFNDYEN